ncbi:iron-sulfur cluster assembly scaffold protein [Devosia sp. BSSL-BM10]|uniref:Iron-sulfur cluster assembly scaffold protein n=1 Tax=Devosia litorisediminis TaxID=2829817 RepID=A0A942E8W8_9HYPH|nr:iron-sulfur cluster assembly scaffold protein [Devosia litorisediminis]MBS3848009.1 iron-sulfur cluster assembly scaffold protein [Devosia litorisediminis]
MELSALYSQKILDLAGNAQQPPRLAAPHASARKVSRVCGSVIEVDLNIEDGVIVSYGHDVSACALGQTSAAVVAREIVGTPVDQFRALRDQMHAMLKDNGAPPAGKWSDLGYLEPVREYRARHMSTLLVFDAVVAAIEKAQSAESVEMVR